MFNISSLKTFLGNAILIGVSSSIAVLLTELLLRFVNPARI